MKKDDDELLGEARDIKRLLILQLMEGGTPQGRIALMLGISPATMSRMLPKGLSKSIKGGE
jgi:predicted transcriptional regulator